MCSQRPSAVGHHLQQAARRELAGVEGEEAVDRRERTALAVGLRAAQLEVLLEVEVGVGVGVLVDRPALPVGIVVDPRRADRLAGRDGALVVEILEIQQARELVLIEHLLGSAVDELIDPMLDLGHLRRAGPRGPN